MYLRSEKTRSEELLEHISYSRGRIEQSQNTIKAIQNDIERMEWEISVCEDELLEIHGDE